MKDFGITSWNHEDVVEDDIFMVDDHCFNFRSHLLACLILHNIISRVRKWEARQLLLVCTICPVLHEAETV